jgi:4-oxalocrotonate tautomerase
MSKQNLFGHLKLEFGVYLGFACLPVGREFVIWNFRRQGLCLPTAARRYALCAFRFRKEIVMPIVQISMIQGRTPEKKEQLIKKVTEAIIEVLKVPADRVRIILNEVPKENLGYGGVPLSKLDL